MNRTEILNIIEKTGIVNKLDVEWITIEETCKYLRIGRGAVYKMIDSGFIESVILIAKKGNKRGVRLVNVQSIRDYIQKLLRNEKKKQRTQRTPPK